MPRKRPPAQTARVKEPVEATAAAASERPLPIGQLAAFGVLVIVWLALYFTTLGKTPDLHLRQRVASLNFLAAPDELFVMWCGGKLAFFSLLDRWPIVLLTAAIVGG